jgi:hypothetical protein
MFRVLASIACLPLAGCVQSTVPLESGEQVTDPALTGIWKSDVRGDPLVATVHPEKDGRLLADIQSYSGPGPATETQHFEIVLARFGAQRYMSMREIGSSPNYSLARYVVVNRDRFCVFATFSEALAGDIDRKILPGKIQQDRHMATVTLDASAGQLRDYFGSRGAEAFSEEDVVALVFQRVASDQLPPARTQPDDPDDFVPTRCHP